MTPLISVVVPVYNVEKYLDRCINSLLNQTYQNIEIILVDDGSTDSSLSICQKYAEIHNNIYVISQTNQGANFARKNGIANSHGSFIAFLDSDDWIHEKAYEILLNTLIKENSDIVQCNFISVDDSSNDNIEISNFSAKTYSGKDALSQLFCVSKEQNFNYLLWNKLYKKWIFDKFDYPCNVKIINDVPVIPRTFCFANKITYIEQPLVYYFSRNSKDNESTMDKIKNNNNLNIFNHMLAFNDVSNYFESTEPKEYYYMSLNLTAKWTVSAIIHCRKDKNTKSLISTVLTHNFWQSNYIKISYKIILIFSKLLIKCGVFNEKN